jgi:hypothetical protein
MQREVFDSNPFCLSRMKAPSLHLSILLEQLNTSSIVTTSPIKEVPDGLFNEQKHIMSMCGRTLAFYS